MAVLVLVGTDRSTVSRPLEPRSQATASGPAIVGTEPVAPARPRVGGVTARRTVPSWSGATKVTPRRDSCIATSAEDPHPCDMESPIRSLGDHCSQVNVPPTATL